MNAIATQLCDGCKRIQRLQQKVHSYVKHLLDAAASFVKKRLKNQNITVRFLSGESLIRTLKLTSTTSYRCFGIGKDKDEHFWNAVVRQSVVSGLLSKDIESYGVLKLTEAGVKFKNNPSSFLLSKERDYLVIDDDSIVVNNGGGAAFDQGLYDQLVDLRKSLSKKKDIPPFVVFQEPSLKDMCFQYPITIEELTNVQGVGNGKAQRYGVPSCSTYKSLR